MKEKKTADDGNPGRNLGSGLIVPGLVILFLIILPLSFALHGSGIGPQQVAEAQENDDFDYDYEIVRGYFNMITYEGSFEGTSIELEHETEVENHSYRWEYEDGRWSGDTELLLEDDTWFDDDDGDVDDGEWHVRIAVEHEAPTGDDWTLVIDGEQRSVNVVEPYTPTALIGHLSFLIEPFSEDGVSNASITVPNEGNVPLTYEVRYDDADFTGELICEEDMERVQPGERIEVEFTYRRSTTDSPERYTISDIEAKNIFLTVYYHGQLDREAEGNVIIGAEKELTVNGVVEVGYEGYEREYEDDYAIQYQQSVSVDGDTTNNITYYVYPEEQMPVYLEEENVTIEDRSIDFSAPLDPDEDEIPIKITFRSHHINDGEVTLIVGADEYTTLVEIDEIAPDPDAGDDDFFEGQESVITGIVIFAVIIGVMAVRHWWGKVEGKGEVEGKGKIEGKGEGE